MSPVITHIDTNSMVYIGSARSGCPVEIHIKGNLQSACIMGVSNDIHDKHFQAGGCYTVNACGDLFIVVSGACDRTHIRIELCGGYYCDNPAYPCFGNSHHSDSHGTNHEIQLAGMEQRVLANTEAALVSAANTRLLHKDLHISHDEIRGNGHAINGLQEQIISIQRANCTPLYPSLHATPEYEIERQCDDQMTEPTHYDSCGYGVQHEGNHYQGCDDQFLQNDAHVLYF